MRIALISMLGLVFLLPGCQVGHVGKHRLEEATPQEIEQLRTREDVIRTFGIPSRVIESRGDVIYRYQNGAQTRLTTSSFIEQHPVFSPVNNRIYFSRIVQGGHSEIFSMDPSGGVLGDKFFYSWEIAGLRYKF